MNLAAWRAELDALVARGRLSHSSEEIAAALAAAGEVLTATSSQVLQPPAPVLGVDGCPTGWVGVLLRPDGRASVHVAATITALVEQVRESADPAVVAIDIPIGLPDRDDRAADSLARAQLPGKGSSVFPTPTRAAYEAPTLEEARRRNIAVTVSGRSVTEQAWALRSKVLEVDAWVRSGPTVTVIEVHPELSFARIAGAPVLAGKRTAEGVRERRELLGAAGLVAPPWYAGQGFAEDDLLDACAAAWSAVRHLRGTSESFPVEPEIFSDGIPAAIRA